MKSVVYMIGVFLLGALLGSYAVAGVVHVDAQGMEYGMEYRDNLWSVCKEFCGKGNQAVIVGMIAEANGIKDVRRIPIGKHIHIPREYLSFSAEAVSEPGIGIVKVGTVSEPGTGVVDKSGDEASVRELRSSLDAARGKLAALQVSAAASEALLMRKNQELLMNETSYNEVSLAFKEVLVFLIVVIMIVLASVMSRASKSNKTEYMMMIRFRFGRLRNRLGSYRFGRELVSKGEMIARTEHVVKSCLTQDVAFVPGDKEIIHGFAEDRVLVFE